MVFAPFDGIWVRCRDLYKWVNLQTNNWWWGICIIMRQKGGVFGCYLDIYQFTTLDLYINEQDYWFFLSIRKGISGLVICISRVVIKQWNSFLLILILILNVMVFVLDNSWTWGCKNKFGSRVVLSWWEGEEAVNQERRNGGRSIWG